MISSVRLFLSLLLGLWANVAAAQTNPQCRVVFDSPPAQVNTCVGSDRVRLALVGDVLLHSPLQRRGYADGFGALWGAVDPILHSADIAIANLEGPVAAGISRNWNRVNDPGARFDNVVYTSYPLFNYHSTVLDALVASGVDVVTTANNHALDRGLSGADSTIAALDAVGLDFVGTELSDGARDFYIERDTRLGRIVLIACSFSSNGVPDRAGQMLWCYQDRAQLLSMISAHAARSDVAAVIVLPHWGYEYVARPNANQTALAADMVAAGAALVVGAHPHVVQTWDQIPGPAGEVPVIYSTGNFVSGQPQFQRQVGMVAWVEMCRAMPGADLVASVAPQMTVAGAGWIPIRMQRTARGPELYSVDEAGAVGVVADARRHIASLVPEGDLGARLECSGTEGLTVALQ